MNKQTIMGLVLIGVILFGFSWYQSRQQKQIIEEKRIQDSIARANAPMPPEAQFDSIVVADEAAGAVQNVQADPLGETMAAARNAEKRNFRLSNDVMDIEFSTLGGAVSDVVLKDFKQFGGGPLHMWKPGSELFDLVFFIKKGYNDAQINTGEFNFAYDISGGTEWSAGEEFKKVAMRLPVDSLAYVEFIYTVPRDDYMLDFSVNFVGMSAMMSNQSNFGIDWMNTSFQNEKGFDNENNFTTISYRFPGEKSVEQLGMARAGQSKSKTVTSKVNWVAFKQHFFSSVLVAEDNFLGADMQFYTFQPGDGTVKKFQTRMTVPMERDKMSYDFRMYFGPNDFLHLKQYDIALERIIPLGMWKISAWVSRVFVIPLFGWLGDHITSFGWIIFIMTFIIKMFMFPLTFTSYKSSAKMRIIKPEMDEISAKYPKQEDAMKKQQALMELNKRAGINPLAGCIPMLIQMPVFIAMFRFFPASIELRQQSLLWADDLSSYDSIFNLPFSIPWYGDHVSLFTLFMAVSMFGYSWLNFKQQASQPQMAGMKFMMLYLMPIMMLFWFNSYASGLTFYYMLSNLFTIALMYGARLAINEDKLRKKMLETARKPKKKSKFMQRYEDAMKAQQRQQVPAKKKK